MAKLDVAAFPYGKSWIHHRDVSDKDFVVLALMALILFYQNMLPSLPIIKRKLTWLVF